MKMLCAITMLLSTPLLGESVITEWNQSLDQNKTNYTVLYHDTARPQLIGRVHTTSTSAMITNLLMGHVYVFRVAVNSSSHGSTTFGTVTYLISPSSTPAVLSLALPPAK